MAANWRENSLSLFALRDCPARVALTKRRKRGVRGSVEHLSFWQKANSEQRLPPNLPRVRPPFIVLASYGSQEALPFQSLPGETEQGSSCVRPRKRRRRRHRSSRPTGRPSRPKLSRPQAAKGGDDSASSTLRCYNIPDYRLEQPEFRIFMSGDGSNLEYRIEGDLSAAAPPIRDSKYLSREQCIALYRWMLLNRRMEVALENSVQAGQSCGRRLFRTGPGGLLLRFGARARTR